MNRLSLHVSAVVVLLAALLALPAGAAVTIPAGEDRWVTPTGGQTFFTFRSGDVESICRVSSSDTWDHKVALRGVPVPGADFDTIVRRLDNATFDSAGQSGTRIVVTRLELASVGQQITPCGKLTWRVSLAGAQKTSHMHLRLTHDAGGVFAADIPVNVEFKAYNANNQYIGSLYYDIILPDPINGTPWSFSSTGKFRPGINSSDDCIAVLRQKLTTYSPSSSHYYYIENLIAQGLCERKN